MKFDRRFFSNLIVFVILVVVGALLTMCQSSKAIRVAYSDDLVAISSKDYNANIAYADVLSIELIDNPDLGSVSDGKNRPELKSGVWQNDTWGEYHLCFNPNATNCIVIRLKDNQTFVFNCNSNEDTVASYQACLSHIPNLSQN